VRRRVDAVPVARVGVLARGDAGELRANPVTGQHDGAQLVGQQSGDRGLAAAGQTADEDRTDLPTPQVPGRDLRVRHGVRRRGRVTLSVPHAGDLGTDERAIGDVVIAQRGRGRIAGILGVPVQKQLAEPGRTQPFQVHREERDVIQPVQPASPVVELEAVQHPRSVVEHEDVVGEQVTVPVHDAARVHSGPEERGPAGEEVPGEPLDLGQRAGVEHPGVHGLDLGEAHLPACGQRRYTALGVDLRTADGPGMERGDLPGQRRDVVVERRPDRTSELSLRSSGIRRLTTSESPGAPSTSDMRATPRYASGARRRLSSTSRSQARCRSSGVLKSRKPRFTGFLSLYARSPTRKTTPM
jgi:hypothetical protein